MNALIKEAIENEKKYIKKTTTFKQYATRGGNKFDKDFFDVEQIVSNLVSSTELDKNSEDDFSDFKLIRDAIGLNDVSGFNTSKEIMDIFEQTFMYADDPADKSCTDIGKVSSRFFIQTAFAKLLHSFNASSAGFVGERLVAGLLGGSTVPVGTGDIADIQVGSTGISLKIKEKGIDGSIQGLCNTFGIPYINNNGKYQKPTQKHVNLFYVIGQKDLSDPKSPKLTFLCFEVSRDGILEIIKDNSSIIDNANEDYYDLSLKTTREKIYKETFLNFGSYSNLDSAGGEKGIVSNSVLIGNYSLDYSIDKVNNSRASLGGALADTLYGMNNFLSDIKEKLMAYSLDPSGTNLNNLLTTIMNVNDFKESVLKNC